MATLYPSLEDMKVDQMAQAQHRYEQGAQAHAQAQVPPQGQITYPGQTGALPTTPNAALYPSLTEYMGFHFTPEFVAQNAVVPAQGGQVAVPVRQSNSGSMQVAPITGDNKGLLRAEIKQGIREVIMCKDSNGQMGVRLRHVNNGLFVALVQQNCPAALAGLKFGDQVLQIDGQNCAGWDTDKAHKVIKNARPERIVFAVRDRPFERTITMQKDSNGYVGFIFKDGRIKSIVKDSSAARNGILTDHQLIEVNGQNVVGLKDDKVSEIIDAGGRTITLTIMPCVLYEHIIKCMGNSLVKKFMDHSIIDV